MKPHRPFTDQERQAVIERYPSEGAKPLAREMGRKQADLVSLAQRLGVNFDGVRRWTAREDELLKRMKQAGRRWCEIAAAVNRTVSAASKRGQGLGLSVCYYDPIAHRRNQQQIRVPGHHGPEVRWARARIRLGEHGWHPDLNPKEVAILESLRTKGPQSRRTLATSLGEPLDRDPKKILMTHGGRSAMSRLLARGLVTKLKLNLDRQCTIIYALTAVAEQVRGSFQSVDSFNRRLLAHAKKEYAA